MVTLQLKQIRVPPGDHVILEDISWQEFETILIELGEHRGSRIAYNQGLLEITVPLPEHEKAKVIIGDLVKILLDELDLDWEPLGSTTFKREDMAVGVEPNDCFYIQNYKLMIGKERIDLSVAPPPDLAIEIDVTSKTKLTAYQALQVPGIWHYEDGVLEINLLQKDVYIKSETSSIFSIPVRDENPRFVQMAMRTGTTLALKAFRKRVREYIES